MLNKIFDNIFHQSIEKRLVDLLMSKKYKIAIAESCTGGLISKKITDVPGSSKCFMGSIVAYDNDIKIKLLGVSKRTLLKHGAVSEETVKEMAIGVKKKLCADIAIATSGIAGPGGGTYDKPVGTVCFGFAIENYVIAFTLLMHGSRKKIRESSSNVSIKNMMNFIVNIGKKK